jgi:DNA-binding SARP family transcriptional activator
MEFHVLGPLEVTASGVAMALGGPKQRALLAALVLHSNTIVSVDKLVETLWTSKPPATAARQVRNRIAALRRMLGPGVLSTRPPGYRLTVGDDQLDLYAFERHTALARRALAGGDASTAAVELRSALGLWRGTSALQGLRGQLFEHEDARLRECRLTVLEERVDADLRLGRHDDLVPELGQLVREHPLRERLVGQLMQALYRCGRQAEALAVFQDLRTRLAGDLGIDPGHEVCDLHQAILRSDALRPAPAAATVRAAQLPADVVGFSGRTGELRQLDEALHSGLVVLTGPAGVGKTALAVHWAHRIRQHFPDGQLHVALRGRAALPPRRPAEVLGRFLRALGAPADSIPTEPDEAAGMYRTLLADKRMLVVLDDAASAEQVRPLLPASPACLVVVTSQDRLGGLAARDGARRLALDVPTQAEAEAILVEVLGADRAEAEAEEVAALADLCARLPLALRIAATNLADHPRQRIADYAFALSRTNRLSALEVDGEAALRTAFGQSYAAAPPEARRLFRLLGFMPRPDITPHAAAALMDTTSAHARYLLGQLAGVHLMTERAPDRFTCHELLRIYGRERARLEEPGAERQTALHRMLMFYRRSAELAAMPAAVIG